jgi:hypothetical protein
MSKERECGLAIRRIAGVNVGRTLGYTYAAKVVSVAGAVCTVERLLDGKRMVEVRLNATINDSEGLVITPAAGSYVLVSCIDGDKWFVSQFSTIEKITLNVADTIEINGGTHGGLCVTPELKTQLEKMTARIDGIIDAINKAVPTPQDGGTALQTTMKVQLATLTDKENFNGIENENFTH